METSELFLSPKTHILLYSLVNNHKIKDLPPELKRKTERKKTWKNMCTSQEAP